MMQQVILEAGRTERQYWKDLWRYRELFLFLAWRDMLVRYKQTVVGVTWAIIRPMATMAVLTVVFGYLAKMPSRGAPYALMVFCGMLPWQFFATALSETGTSLVNNSNLISKVYFPRLVIPASSVITSLVDFFITAAFLLILLIWYKFVPGPQIFWVPLFVILAFAAALGAGLWVAALTVKYRDFKHIVPFCVQFGLYISPVGYSSIAIQSPELRLLYALNPMVGVINGFRWAILGGDFTLNWPVLGVSTFVIVFLVVTGVWYFRKTERTFADVI